MQHAITTKASARGFSFTTFLIALFIIVPVFITVMQAAPVYLEYFAIKRAISRAVRECSSCSKEEIRRIYEKQAQIDEVTSVKAIDLEVKRMAGIGEKGVVVSTEYVRKQELISGAGISLLFEFNISIP